MKTWFTSDHHFGHQNIIKYCDRPFGGVEHMNAEMIRKWNEVVAPEDLVWHLGDVAMGKRHRLPEYRAQLNGRIHLIRGNHDYGDQLSCFDEVHKSMTIELDDVIIEMVHNPMSVKGTGTVAFCGHVHNKWVAMPKGTVVPEYKTENRYEPKFVAPVDIYNVGVDVRDFRPRSMLGILYNQEWDTHD